ILLEQSSYSIGLKPVERMIGPQVAASDLMRAASSLGLLALGTMPTPAKTSAISFKATALPIASEALAMIAGGVAAGANTPYHSATTISLMPCSAKVGMSG